MMRWFALPITLALLSPAALSFADPVVQPSIGAWHLRMSADAFKKLCRPADIIEAKRTHWIACLSAPAAHLTDLPGATVRAEAFFNDGKASEITLRHRLPLSTHIDLEKVTHAHATLHHRAGELFGAQQILTATDAQCPTDGTCLFNASGIWRSLDRKREITLEATRIRFGESTLLGATKKPTTPEVELTFTVSERARPADEQHRQR